MRTESITPRKLKKAIEGSYGIIKRVAKRAGCSTKTVGRKLKQYPELQKQLEEEKATLRKDLNDMADLVILDALENNDRRVAMWVKERLGAGEGYNPTIELKGSPNEPITINFIDKEGSKFEQEKTE